MDKVLEKLLRKIADSSEDVFDIEKLKRTLGLPEEQSAGFIAATLDMLSTLGLVIVDGEHVRLSCHTSKLVLKVITLFRENDRSLVAQPCDKPPFLRDLLLAAESTRKMLEGEVSQAPLHERPVVNVVIKARLVRQWKRQDVYLHVLHPEWQQYHLVGIGQLQQVTTTDDALARIAIEAHLGIIAGGLVLEPLLAGNSLECETISASSGAKTKFAFRFFSVGSIESEVPRRDLVTANGARFRWFTLPEMLQGNGSDGERIIPCPGKVVADLNLGNMPINVRKPIDSRSRRPLREEIGKRITLTQMRILGALGIGSLTLFLVLRYGISFGKESETLANIGSLASLLTAAGSFAFGLYRILRSR